MNRRRLLTLSAAALVAVASLSGPMLATAAAGGEGKAVGQKKFTNNAYIVQLADEPVVAYRGGVKGYAATRPRKGQKIDPNSPAVVSYMSFLASRQDALLASVGASKKLYSFGYVFSGFAAELTPEQAQRSLTLSKSGLNLSECVVFLKRLLIYVHTLSIACRIFTSTR